MASYEHTLERVRTYVTPDMRAFEIGGGTGTTALRLASDVKSITSTDISPEMLRIATQKATEQGIANVTFKVADAQTAAQGIAGYDVVLGFNIFHLAEGAEGIFQTIHDQLAPGGLFISKTPCLAEPTIGLKRFAFAAMIPVMRLIGVAPFVRSLTFATLEGMIERAGFEIVETGNFPAMSRFIVARRT